DRLALLTIELGHRNERRGGDRILPAPWRILPDRRSFGEPSDICRYRQHFFRGRRRKRLTDSRAALASVGGFGIEASRRVLASPETVDDAIVQAVETARPPVVLRKHRGHRDERQRALALPGVQMTVRARHPAGGKRLRLARGVREQLVAPADVLREPRVV